MHPALVWFGSSQLGDFFGAKTTQARVVSGWNPPPPPPWPPFRHLLSLGEAAMAVFSPWPLSILQCLQTVLWPLSSFFFPWHCEIRSLPQGIVSAGRGAPVWSCWLLQPFITSFIISDILLKASVAVSSQSQNNIRGFLVGLDFGLDFGLVLDFVISI